MKAVVTIDFVFGNLLIFLVVSPTNKPLSHLDGFVPLPSDPVGLELGGGHAIKSVSFNKIPFYLSLCPSACVLAFILCRCSSFNSSQRHFLSI